MRLDFFDELCEGEPDFFFELELDPELDPELDLDPELELELELELEPELELELSLALNLEEEVPLNLEEEVSLQPDLFVEETEGDDKDDDASDTMLGTRGDTSLF